MDAICLLDSAEDLKKQTKKYDFYDLENVNFLNRYMVDFYA